MVNINNDFWHKTLSDKEKITLAISKDECINILESKLVVENTDHILTILERKYSRYNNVSKDDKNGLNVGLLGWMFKNKKSYYIRSLSNKHNNTNLSLITYNWEKNVKQTNK